MRFLSFLLFSCLLLTLTSCKKIQTTTNDDDNPFFKQALEFESQQNYVAAIEEYEKALQSNPNMARAHLQMGLIYGDKLSDPISAIYHSQRYLHDRPDATDHDQVQAYIDKCKIDFTRSLPNTPLQNTEEMARLSKENLELKNALNQAQQELAAFTNTSSGSFPATANESELVRLKEEILQLKQALAEAMARQPGIRTLADTVPIDLKTTADASSSGTPLSSSAPLALNTNSPAPSPNTSGTTSDSSAPTTSSTSPEASQPTDSASKSSSSQQEVRKHVIVKGDTLWNIASRYYPDQVPEGVKKIKQANKKVASNEKNLKLGAVLIIP